jgi:LytR cell envelope-related transcriptional attenuator
VSEIADRRPSGARRRRPLPGLIFLLVLALGALFVWWNVLSDEHARDEAQAAACSSATAVPDALDPASITLRVLNATDVAGQAGVVAQTMTSRGFTVSETANDPTDNKVTGVGELRFGPRGKKAAAFLALYLPGATNRADTRATDVVDLVIGPDFKALATQEQVDAALNPAAAKTGC